LEVLWRLKPAQVQQVGKDRLCLRFFLFTRWQLLKIPQLEGGEESGDFVSKAIFQL
jgi:hypothetical protein